jgi:hypothetical protein
VRASCKTNTHNTSRSVYIFRASKDVVFFFILISVLLVVLVIGLWYTAQNCRKLARTIRAPHDGDNINEQPNGVDRMTLQVQNEVTNRLRQSSKTQHEQLGEQLQSMQQVQLDVASQLVEIKSALAQYATMQQQQQHDNEKQD